MVNLEDIAREYRSHEKAKQQEIVDYINENIPQEASIYSVTDKYTFLTERESPYKWTSLSPLAESLDNFDDFCEFIEDIDYIIFTGHQKKYLGKENLECVYSSFEIIKTFKEVSESDVEILRKID